MRDETPNDRRLERIEAGLDRLQAAMTALTEQIDIIQQECQRSATQMHRLGLNQESARLAAQRHEKSLKAVAAELAGVKSALRHQVGE